MSRRLSRYFCGRSAAFVSLISAAALVVLSLSSFCAGPAAQPAGAAPRDFANWRPACSRPFRRRLDPQDTVTDHDVVEIQTLGKQLDWKPQTQSSSTTLKVLTKDIPFRRDVWNLEFSFKPLRMMYVDLPQEGGNMQRTLVWYLVYRVKNLGGHLQPEPTANSKDFANHQVDYPVRFFPQFVLETDKYKKAYLDRVLPLAVEAIQKREDPNRKLLDSVEMSNQDIPVSKPGEDHSVWGVATWTDIDPRIDYFSIYVGGLSNAYRFADPPGAYKQGEPPGSGRLYAQKTLKLNFWRPGDEHDINEGEIYYGGPDKVDHEWVFR